MGRNEGFMLESIIKINQAVNGFIWGVPAMICIIGVGLLLSVRTRFIQVRKFGAAMKNTIGKIFDKTQAKDGSMLFAATAFATVLFPAPAGPSMATLKDMSSSLSRS